MNNYIKHIVEAFDFNNTKKDSLSKKVDKIIQSSLKPILDAIDNIKKEILPDIDLNSYGFPVYTPKNKEELHDIIKGYIAIYKFKQDIIDLNWLNVSHITDMSNLFKDTNPGNVLDLSKWDVSNVTNMYAIFAGCNMLTDLFIEDWDVSNVTNMSWAFYYCESLMQCNLDKWDVSNVTDMSGMFSHSGTFFKKCLSNWNVSNVTNMENMFSDNYYLHKVYIDIANWDVSNVTNMNSMFSQSEKISCNLNQWQPKKLTLIDNIFYKNKNIKRPNWLLYYKKQ